MPISTVTSEAVAATTTAAATTPSASRLRIVSPNASPALTPMPGEEQNGAELPQRQVGRVGELPDDRPAAADRPEHEADDQRPTGEAEREARRRRAAGS